MTPQNMPSLEIFDEKKNISSTDSRYKKQSSKFKTSEQTIETAQLPAATIGGSTVQTRNQSPNNDSQVEHKS